MSVTPGFEPVADNQVSESYHFTHEGTAHAFYVAEEPDGGLLMMHVTGTVARVVGAVSPLLGPLHCQARREACDLFAELTDQTDDAIAA